MTGWVFVSQSLPATLSPSQFLLAQNLADIGVSEQD